MRSISQKNRPLKSILDNLSTIIFDLGGVLIDLDTNRSIESFSALSGLSAEEVYAKFIDDQWSYAFEKGEIDTATFRDEVRKSLKIDISDNQIDDSWNAMLLDIPLARLNLIDSLRDKYQVFVLSNTNAIHVETFNKKVAAATNGALIHDYFDKIYYSHELGMRKPDAEIFSHVIDTNNLKPAETLFIDDMEINIAGAQSVGLRTVHLTDQAYLTELFS